MSEIIDFPEFSKKIKQDLYNYLVLFTTINTTKQYQKINREVNNKYNVLDCLQNFKIKIVDKPNKLYDNNQSENKTITFKI